MGRLFVGLILTVGILFAQPKLVLGPVQGNLWPGQDITIPVTLTNSSGMAGVNWRFVSTTVPQSWNASAAVTVGPNATAAAKTVTCSDANRTCILVGNNLNSFGEGLLFTWNLKIPANATLRTYGVTLDTVAAVADNGGEILMATTTAINFAVVAPPPPPLSCDLNGDGLTTDLDIANAINQVLKIAPCTNGDLNKNGVCNVADVQIVVNAVQGKGCQVPTATLAKPRETVAQQGIREQWKIDPVPSPIPTKIEPVEGAKVGPPEDEEEWIILGYRDEQGNLHLMKMPKSALGRNVDNSFTAEEDNRTKIKF